MATDTTLETGLGIILRPCVPRAGLPGSEGGPATYGARPVAASDRAAWRLSSLALALGLIAVLFGAFLLTYGIALRVVDGTGQGYPTIQHVSTQPTPRG